MPVPVPPRTVLFKDHTAHLSAMTGAKSSPIACANAAGARGKTSSGPIRYFALSVSNIKITIILIIGPLLYFALSGEWPFVYILLTQCYLMSDRLFLYCKFISHLLVILSHCRFLESIH